MAFSSGKKENGIVFGNAYDKYGSNNPIVKHMMRGFDRSLERYISQTGANEFHEIGCGEGYWVLKYLEKGFNTRGSDFSSEVISIAKSNATERGVSEDLFTVKSIYDLNAAADSSQLIVCCEVLEHLENPQAGLEKIKEVARNYVILSVPSEPLWRVLNLARLKYISQLGNTPGHLNHWSRNKFVALISEYFDVLSVSSPTPWTMLLCQVKKD